MIVQLTFAESNLGVKSGQAFYCFLLDNKFCSCFRIETSAGVKFVSEARAKNFILDKETSTVNFEKEIPHVVDDERQTIMKLDIDGIFKLIFAIAENKKETNAKVVGNFQFNAENDMKICIELKGTDSTDSMEFTEVDCKIKQ